METINYNPMMVEKEIVEMFENMFPIFVTHEIVITNMEI